MNRIAAPAATSSSSRSRPGGLAWTAFLGCSWTWCIGMFLPVLLVRDFGLAGWLVFAVPNVVGAAAMGWVLDDPESSRAFIDRHRAACFAFSAVTIVFHLFFVGWVIVGLLGFSAIWVVAVLILVMLAALWNDLGGVVLAWLVFAVSVGLFFVAFGHANRGSGSVPLTGLAATRGLLGLAPVCVFGFLLCPYLDLTFHRARQATHGREGASAFTAGFGGCFLAMILFSLWYARLLLPGEWQSLSRPLAQAIGAHLAVQSAFTIAAHLRSMFVEWRPPASLGLLAGLAVSVPLLLGWMFNLVPPYGLHTSSETTYRLFMGFYGLVFPAYLWVLAPNEGSSTSRRFVMLLFTLVLAAPFFWLGFIADRMLWLVPGLLIVLGSRLLMAPRVPRAAS